MNKSEVSLHGALDQGIIISSSKHLSANRLNPIVHLLLVLSLQQERMAFAFVVLSNPQFKDMLLPVNCEGLD